MKRLPILITAVALLACQSQEHSKTVVYRAPGELFSCRAPARWRVLENLSPTSRALFFGPSGELIAVYFYPGRALNAEEAELRAAQTVPKLGPLAAPLQRPWRQVEAYEFTIDTEQPDPHGAAPRARREKTLLLPAKSGYFSLVYSAPPAFFSASQPLFDEMVAGFMTPDGIRVGH